MWQLRQWRRSDRNRFIETNFVCYLLRRIKRVNWTMSMIKHLRFINFRSHSDTSIALQPINLLIGPVAAGKSNLLKGLLFIQNSVHRTLIELFPPGLGEFQWVRSRWAG